MKTKINIFLFSLLLLCGGNLYASKNDLERMDNLAKRCVKKISEFEDSNELKKWLKERTNYILLKEKNQSKIKNALVSDFEFIRSLEKSFKKRINEIDDIKSSLNKSNRFQNLSSYSQYALKNHLRKLKIEHDEKKEKKKSKGKISPRRKESNSSEEKGNISSKKIKSINSPIIVQFLIERSKKFCTKEDFQIDFENLINKKNMTVSTKIREEIWQNLKFKWNEKEKKEEKLKNQRKQNYIYYGNSNNFSQEMTIDHPVCKDFINEYSQEVMTPEFFNVAIRSLSISVPETLKKEIWENLKSKWNENNKKEEEKRNKQKNFYRGNNNNAPQRIEQNNITENEIQRLANVFGMSVEDYKKQLTQWNQQKKNFQYYQNNNNIPRIEQNNIAENEIQRLANVFGMSVEDYKKQLTQWNQQKKNPQYYGNNNNTPQRIELDNRQNHVVNNPPLFVIEEKQENNKRERKKFVIPNNVKDKKQFVIEQMNELEAVDKTCVENINQNSHEVKQKIVQPYQNLNGASNDPEGAYYYGLKLTDDGRPTETFNRLKNLFISIEGPITVNTGKALKLLEALTLEIAEEQKINPGNLCTTVHLKFPSEALSTMFQMYIQLIGENKELLRLLIMDQDSNCGIGLLARLSFRVIEHLKEPLKDYKKDNPELFKN